MQASLLRELVDIYVPNLTKNEYGEQVQTYEKLYTTKAYIRHTYGQRSEENDEIITNYRKTFTIRKYHNLNEKMYVKYQRKFYRILSIEEVPDNQSIILQTELVNE